MYQQPLLIQSYKLTNKGQARPISITGLLGWLKGLTRDLADRMMDMEVVLFD